MEIVYNILLLVIAGFSIIANFLVLDSCRKHFRSMCARTSRLIIFLHVSCLLQNICSVPYIFTFNTVLCEFMSFAHYYFGLINVFGIVFLALEYFSLVVVGLEWFLELVSTYGLLFPIFFSLVTLLPFLDNSYGKVDIWCSLTVSDTSANNWSFIIFYFWVLLATCISIGIYSYIWYVALKVNADAQYSQKLFNFLGVYILISIFYLIPRLAYRMVGLFEPGYHAPDVFSFIAGIPMYLAGIAYCLTYYYCSDALEREEQDQRERLISIPERTSHSFLWSIADRFRSGGRSLPVSDSDTESID